MTSRHLSLDALPLFATDAELAGAIMGERQREWSNIATLLETRGLPKINDLMMGRYVPAVRRFFDVDNGVEGIGPPTASDGVEDMSVWKTNRNLKTLV